MTTPLISKALEQYTETYTTPESPLLAALNRETQVKTTLPVMLSGHLQGMVLQMLSKMIQPENILEIGTFTGYSAICLAQGLREGGHLHTIDIDEEFAHIADGYFKQAGLQKKITQHIGNAADIIPAIDKKFDLVFIDADKVNYGLYYDIVFDKVVPGGFILADNVLYDGEVILPDEQQSKNGKAIYAFNNKIKQDSRIEHVLLPVRDGVMIIRKKTN